MAILYSGLEWIVSGFLRIQKSISTKHKPDISWTGLSIFSLDQVIEFCSKPPCCHTRSCNFEKKHFFNPFTLHYPPLYHYMSVSFVHDWALQCPFWSDSLMQLLQKLSHDLNCSLQSLLDSHPLLPYSSINGSPDNSPPVMIFIIVHESPYPSNSVDGQQEINSRNCIL